MSRRVVPLLCILVLWTLWAAPTGCSDPAAPGGMPATVGEVEKWLSRGDPEGARAELDDMRGRLADGWEDFLDGRILTAEGRFEEAVAPLERARGALPDDPDVFDTLQSVYARLGRRDEERALIDGYVARNPHDERGLFALAVLLVDRGAPGFDPERAAGIVKGMRERRESGAGGSGRSRVSDERLRKLSTAVDSLTGRAASACAAAQEQAEASGAAEDYLRWADEARKIGRLNTALRAIDGAIDAAPGEFRYLSYRAQLFLLPRQLTEEHQRELLLLTEDLLRRFPEERDAHVLRARALVRGEDVQPGATDQAKDIYEAVLERDPDDLDALRNLALILYDWKQGGQRGQYLHDARRHLARYIQLGGKVDPLLADVWRKLEERTKDE